MGDKECTVRARELGSALRRAVQASGLSNMDLARRLGWSPSKVTYLFQGKRGHIETDVAQVLAVCRIVDKERDYLLSLTRDTHKPGWWQEYEDRLPTELRTLIDHEDSAVAITSFETVIVPGLLQTGDYMRTLLRTSATIPNSEVEFRVTARLNRQQIFDRRGLAKFCFLIDEYALRRTGPGQAAMSEQVHHLLRMSVRRNVQIRVIPDRIGFHAGRKPFHFMEFAERGPVVHVEDETSVLFLEREKTVRSYRNIADELATVAMNEGQSREWIARLAAGLGEPRREHDEPTRLAEEHVQRPEQLRRGGLAG